MAITPILTLGGVVFDAFEKNKQGLIETFAKVYISTQYSDAIVFFVLIVILLVKPAGLLGKRVQEKV